MTIKSTNDLDETTKEILWEIFSTYDISVELPHPDITFSNMNVYWDDYFGRDNLVFEFDLTSPFSINEIGFWCWEEDGTPIGGGFFGSLCKAFELNTNQMFASNDLVAMLVPGSTYHWRAYAIYEGEKYNSPRASFIQQRP